MSSVPALPLPTAPISPYFHSKSLQLRFSQDVSATLDSGHIDGAEAQWLQTVVTPRAEGLGWIAPRLDRLVKVGVLPADAELAAAVQISYRSSYTTLYLHTPLYGLERFIDRESLLRTLLVRFGSKTAEVPSFEDVLIERPLFEDTMLSIIDFQVTKLDELLGHLQLIPTLHSVVGGLVQQRFDAAMPGEKHDWSSHLLQILQVSADTIPTYSVEGVQSLLEAALDDCSGAVLAPSLERRYFDRQGQTLDATGLQLAQKAMSDSITALTTTFETQLGKYWWSPIGQGQTRREYFAAAFAEGFRQELYAHRNDGSLIDAHFHRISVLLDPRLKKYGDGGPLHLQSLTVVTGSNHRLRLAGVFVIERYIPSSPELLVYSAGKGLRQFRDRLELNEHFANGAGRAELLDYLALSDRWRFNRSQPWIEYDTVASPPFLDAIDSIMALQNSNLLFALKQSKPAPNKLAVMIDDALDIRLLIDRRLACLKGHDRWSETPGMYADTWLTGVSDSGVSTLDDEPKNLAIVRSSSWSQLLHLLDEDIGSMWQTYPGARACALELLNKHLSVMGEGRLDARNIRVRLAGATLVDPGLEIEDSLSEEVELITLLLERFSGYRTAIAVSQSQIKNLHQAVFPPDNVVRLTPDLLDYVLNRAQSELSAALVNQTEKFYGNRLRRGDSQIFPRLTACDARAVLLRIELSLQGRLDHFDSQVYSAFEQALNFPESGLRQSLGNKAVEVHSVWFNYEAGAPAAQMTNIFVIKQPLIANSKILLWTPFRGIDVFQNYAALEKRMKDRLNSSHHRGHWLYLFSEPQRSAMRKVLESTDGRVISIDTRQVDGHFIEDLCQVDIDRRTQGVSQAVEFLKRCNIGEQLFCRLINAAQRDDPISIALDITSSTIQTALFKAKMPSWLDNASVEDLQRYSDVIDRYSQLSKSEHDFLFDIPKLSLFAREKVVDQLRIDFPDHLFDPDTIIVTLKRYVGEPTGTGQTPSYLAAATQVFTESLTQFALYHFSAVQGAALSVSSAAGDSLVTSQLTPDYLRALIRKLDVGLHFQELLRKKLDDKGPDYATRKSLFCKQWPAFMIELALQKKLEGKLSAQAFEFIRGVMDMPDSTARQPIDDQDIVLRPIRLISQPGAQVDRVPGYYVIGPKDLSKGPVVLYSIFNKRFCFKEYLNQESLLLEIRTLNSLQEQLMQRVSPEVQMRYDRRSFYIPPVLDKEYFSLEYPMFFLGPVALDNKPQMGNTLECLFEDVVGIFLDIAKRQTVTTAQADWESFTYLMTLGVEQSLVFLPGELSLLITAWQGVSLLESSATSVAHREWGKALAEFTVALSVFASTKQAAAEELKSELEQLPTVRKSNLAVEFSWQNSQLPAEVKLRLQVFEAPTISLSDLLRDDLYNLYQSPLSEKKYAAVAGKVYEVREVLDKWYIVSDDKVGPNVRLNFQQQWELNIQWGLKGGGGALTRNKTSEEQTVINVNTEVEREFTVVASGIPAIRRLYASRARQIGEAQLQAKNYLETCLDNLSLEPPNPPLSPQVSKIISDFFGVPKPDLMLLSEIRQAVTGVFNAIMDASLSTRSSARYVIGLNKPGNEDTIAFTVKSDPLMRIFLTQRFFKTPHYQLKAPIPGSSFKLETHYRAGTVVHENTHLSNDTFDIAYLESTAPFLDLLAENTPDLIRVKNDLEEVQKRFLSHETPVQHLFKRFRHGRWKDINVDEGKDFVLEATGTSNLENARVEFFANPEKRAKVLLRNADSLTLLILQLGRKNFVA